MFDATGRLIYKSILKDTSEIIETGNWNNGLYLIVIHQENKKYTQQLIIE